MTAPVNVGDVLAGKYQVERVLGEGGMGVVIAARDLVLGERVAIKFLLPEALGRGDVVARFLREGQAARRIRSEHVTRVYDAGKLDGGQPYLVMEYLDGSDLGVVLQASGRLSIETACEYVLQACEALAEAHSLGIVHRDLKPTNLFLSHRADGTPLIKIIDFGISKMALSVEQSGSRGDMTQSAMMMGSPLYMAPEQMVSSKNVDARSDIWSLGVVLHQLLAGSLPFIGESILEIYDRVLHGPPPLRRLRGDVPEAIEAAVLRCLHRNAADRFNNVAELAAELAPFAPAHAQVSVERASRVLRVRVGEGRAAGRASSPSSPASAASAARPSATPLDAARPSDMTLDAARPSDMTLDAGRPSGAPLDAGRPSGAPLDVARPSGAPLDAGRPSAVPAASAWGTPPTAQQPDAGMMMTGRSWGGTRPPMRAGKRGGLLLGLVGGVLAILGVGAAWLALRPAEPARGVDDARGSAITRADSDAASAAAALSAGTIAAPSPEPLPPAASAMPQAAGPASASAARSASPPPPSLPSRAPPRPFPPRTPPPQQQPDLFGDPR